MRTIFQHLLVSGALLGAVGCHGSQTPRDGGGGTTFQRDWVRNPAVFTFTGATGITALGDVHGDLDVTVRTLSAAGLVAGSSPFRWTGGTRILVVTGDVIDKGSAATPIIDLFRALEAQASAAGGAVVVTLGNHEAEFLANPSDPKSSVFQAELQALGLDPIDVAAGQSVYGAWLLTRPVAALIDGWFFCHAGDSGGISAAAITVKFQALFGDPPAPEGGLSGFRADFLTGSGSLLESTTWWKEGDDPRAAVDARLAALPASHIVFGHDPGAAKFPDDPAGDRSMGEMVSRYEGRLFMVDVGMSYAVGYSDGASLRIDRGIADAATRVDVGGSSALLWP